jgi:malate dehydrogenase (oxaloacetate-decarboxylating)
MTSPALQRDPHISSAHKATQSEAKHPKFGNLPLSTSGPQDCALRGTALLATPYFNKGAAFTAEEREEFNLTGLLPQNVQTLDQQVKRAYDQYKTRSDPLAKNTFMTSLAIQNQVLYYRVSTLYLGYQNGFSYRQANLCSISIQELQWSWEGNAHEAPIVVCTHSNTS